MSDIELNKKVPDITGLDSNGKKIKLSSLVGEKGLVLYFYPRDNTPGCTTEACDFRDNLKKLNKLGYNVVGVSKDSMDSHKKFIQKFELNFLLFADEDHSICEKFGVWKEKTFMGKKSMGIVRTTFILDKSLKLMKTYNNVKAKGHVEQIIKGLDA